MWPRLAPLVVLAALFAAVSWFGLWRLIPDTPVSPSSPAFVVAAALPPLPAFRHPSPEPRPQRSAGSSRRPASLHRPATAFADRLAAGADDPASQALWAAHRARLLAALDRLKAGIPAPDLARRDPRAFRFLVALLFVVAFVYAGSGAHRAARPRPFAAARPASATIARIDAWVTPPAYTGRAPIFLTGEAAKPPGTQYSVPAGSIVTVRTGGAHDLDVVSIVGDRPRRRPQWSADPAEAAAAGGDKPLERKLDARSGRARSSIRKGEREVASWRFAVEPDNRAARSLSLKPPAPTASGALGLTYTLRDDYGVVCGDAEIAPVDRRRGRRRRRGRCSRRRRSPLSLPQLRTRDGTGETIRDLTSHPWAGAKVRMTLVATRRGRAGRPERAGRGRPAGAQFHRPARPGGRRAARQSRAWTPTPPTVSPTRSTR